MIQEERGPASNRLNSHGLISHGLISHVTRIVGIPMSLVIQ